MARHQAARWWHRNRLRAATMGLTIVGAATVTVGALAGYR